MEGSFGSSAMQFDVELTGAAEQPVTFTASTRGGTAASGADFTKLQDSPFTIAAGQSSGIVQVNLVATGFRGRSDRALFRRP